MITHKIGVVTPTHPQRIVNGMLNRALVSVMKQTYAASAMCVYNDQDKMGAPYSRQRALEMNSEKWTAFLDSDDWFDDNHLEVLVNAQRETDADYVYSWFRLVQFNREVDDYVFPSTHYTEPWDPANPRQTTMTVLVRTELAREIGFWDVSDAERFPDGHRKGEDWVFTQRCNELGKIHHVVEKTWFWHHHGLNTSGRADSGDAK